MANFDISQEEKKREKKRKKIIAGINPEKLVDDFPMFIDRQNLVRYLVRYELFKMIMDVKGSIVECGVYRGASLMLFAQLSACFEPYALNRRIIGFDTFEGFTRIQEKDGSRAFVGDLADCDFNILKKSIELYDANRPTSHILKIELIKGDASKTIPDFFKKNPHLIVSLLYLDFDLYEPTKAAINNILPRMPKGSIIAFDELNEERWQGETTALFETMDIRHLKIKKFPWEPHISYAIL